MSPDAQRPLFSAPVLKDQIGWRLNEQDKKDMRIVMASVGVKSPTALLRALVQREAALVRRRWTAAIEQEAKGKQ